MINCSHIVFYGWKTYICILFILLIKLIALVDLLETMMIYVLLCDNILRKQKQNQNTKYCKSNHRFYFIILFDKRNTRYSVT